MQTVEQYTLRNFCSQTSYLLVRFILIVNSLSFLCSKSNASGSQTSVITMEAVKRFLSGIFPSLRAAEDDQPKYEFPGTIEEFGYIFNDQGQLVSKFDMTGRFVFNVKDDRNYNQQRYDALGEAITDYLYDMMVKNLKLEKVYLPVDDTKEPLSFIFQSPDALTADKLMVLIHGSGVVRAGQWSRKLIINENIDEGSQFPYIRRAMADGYGVIVMNTNLNKAVVNGKLTDIRENNTPEKHGLYVWSHIISKAAAKNIVVVAHSYGGIVLCNILEKHLQDFEERVFCVVFTDSVHSADRSLWSKPAKEFLKERAVNFASTYVPINLIMQSTSPDDVMSVSAGTKEHERTSSACIESAFKFIHDNYETWTRDRTMAPRTDFKPLPDDLSMYSPAKEWEKKTGEAVARRKEEEEEEELKRKSAAKQELMATEPETLADLGYVQQQDVQQQQMQQQLQQQPLPHQQVEKRNTEQKDEEVEFAEDAMEVNLESDNKLREDGKASETVQSVGFTTHLPVRQEDVQGNETVQEKAGKAFQEKTDEGKQLKSEEDIKPVDDAYYDAKCKPKVNEDKTVDSEKADGDDIKTEGPLSGTEKGDGGKSKAEKTYTTNADGDKAKSEFEEKANTRDGNTATVEEPCTQKLAGEKSSEQTSGGEEICINQGASEGVFASHNSEATPADVAEELMDIICEGKSTEEAEAKYEDGTTVMTVESGDEQ